MKGQFAPGHFITLTVSILSCPLGCSLVSTLHPRVRVPPCSLQSMMAAESSSSAAGYSNTTPDYTYVVFKSLMT